MWSLPDRSVKRKPAIVKELVPNVFQGDELRNLQFFRYKTSATIGSPFSRTLWEDIVPVMAQHEPSMKFAVIALAELHEDFMAPNSSGRNLKDMGLRHYNHAIQALVGPKAQQAHPVVGLLCCLVFFAMELIQGKLLSAVQLFISGRRIIYDLRETVKSDYHQQMYRILKELFIRLEYHVGAFFPQLDLTLSFNECYSKNSDKGSVSKIDNDDIEALVNVTKPLAIFNSIDQAQEELRRISHGWIDESFAGDADHQACVDILGKWCVAFECLKDTLPKPIGQADLHQIAKLEIWWRQVEISVLAARDSSNSSDYLWWDQHENRLGEILSWIEVQLDLEIVAHDNEYGFRQQTASFCLEVGFVSHLASVIARCRNPHIRRRALLVLQAGNRQEGLYLRDLVVGYCTRMIELEEGNRIVLDASDVPREARIVHSEIAIHPDKPELTVKYLVGNEWVEEIMTWKPT